MQDDQYDALMQVIFQEESPTSGIDNESVAGRDEDRIAQKRNSPEWITVLRCLRRIRRWRVPPHWSERDWFDEIIAEVTLSVIQATNDFDLTRGIPFGGFLHRRIMHTALGRYRREWTYAIHRVSEAAVEEFEAVNGGEYLTREAIGSLLRDALARLPSSDSSLIEGIFWEGKSEANMAEGLGISQQAVNKRKHNILKLLDQILKTRFPQITALIDQGRSDV